MDILKYYDDRVQYSIMLRTAHHSTEPEKIRIELCTYKRYHVLGSHGWAVGCLSILKYFTMVLPESTVSITKCNWVNMCHIIQ